MFNEHKVVISGFSMILINIMSLRDIENNSPILAKNILSPRDIEDIVPIIF
jgi:hypothetical protein